MFRSGLPDGEYKLPSVSDIGYGVRVCASASTTLACWTCSGEGQMTRGVDGLAKAEDAARRAEGGSSPGGGPSVASATTFGNSNALALL